MRITDQSGRAGCLGLATVGEVGLSIPEVELGSPEVGFGSPEVGFGSPEVGFGSPEVGFGIPKGRNMASTELGGSDTTVGTSSSNRLRSGSLGVAGVVFFVIATVAPMGGTVSGLPLNIGLGSGPGTAGTFIIVAVIMLLFVVGYVAMSRHIVSAGGFYVYIGQAFGARAGRAAGYTAFFSYNIFQIALWGVFGFFLNSILLTTFSINISWIILALGGIALTGILGYFSVNVSASILGLSMTLEILVLLVMDFAILVSGGAHGLTAQPFHPNTVVNGGDLGVGLMFCLILFIGIEATVIYAEEARTPRRTIPRAGVTAVLVIAGFYVLTSYALTIGYGTNAVAHVALADPANFVFNAGRQSVGGFLVAAMKILFVVSVFADNLGFHNAINRYVYALARDGWMPAPMQRTHARHDSPYIASFFQTTIAAIVVLGFFAAGKDPYNQMFLWLISLGGLGLMLLLACTSFGAIPFYRRHHLIRSPWVAIVAPGLAAIGLVVQVILDLAHWDIQTGITGGIIAYLPVLLAAPILLGFLWPATRKPANWRVEASAW